MILHTDGHWRRALSLIKMIKVTLCVNSKDLYDNDKTGLCYTRMITSIEVKLTYRYQGWWILCNLVKPPLKIWHVIGDQKFSCAEIQFPDQVKNPKLPVSSYFHIYGWWVILA